MKARVELPFVLAPGRDDVPADRRLDALVAWLEAHRALVDARLVEHGAIALRGFAIEGIDDFRRVVAALGQPIYRYLGGVSPRTRYTDDVASSTDFPPRLPILPHNELAHVSAPNARIIFYAAQPSEAGGATTLAHGRDIAAALDPAVRERFAARGLGYYWTYLARTSDGLSRVFKSWQEALQTEVPDEAEAACRALGLACGWSASGMLWTWSRGPALVADPVDGTPLWFGQLLVRMHLSHVDQNGIAAAIAAGHGRHGLMRYVAHGDATPIAADDGAHVAEVSAGCETPWTWQRGDVLVVDNLRCQHGRRPFQGARSILVSLTGTVALDGPG